MALHAITASVDHMISHLRSGCNSCRRGQQKGWHRATLFLFERMKHGAHHVVVSPINLGIVTVRVNAPHLPGWVVLDEPLISFDVGCVTGDLQ